MADPMGNYRFGAARCALCDREIALKKDGTFRQHQAYLSSGRGVLVQFPPMCAGTGRTPEAAQARQQIKASHA